MTTATIATTTTSTPPAVGTIQALVEYIVGSIVDAPDAVYVHAAGTEHSVSVEITVAEEDKGRVIGKEGRTINALRALARVLGGKRGQRVAVEVV